MIVVLQRSITVRLRRMRRIFAVVTAVVPSVTYDCYFSGSTTVRVRMILSVVTTVVTPVTYDFLCFRGVLQ